MDCSIKFFGQMNVFEKTIKKLINEGAEAEMIALAKENKRQYIIQGMKKALFEKGYSIIVEDIAQFLDIDEKQVRANIVPQLDYITAPEGAAEFFIPEENTQMTFLEMRIKKWKRLFINKDSFENFLERHLVLYCPYTSICWNDEMGQYIATGQGETPLPYRKEITPSLIRKCNIADIIRNIKIADLVRKTKNDITKARMLGLISVERLKEEEEIVANMHKNNAITVQVHNQEIKKYIEKTPHYRFHLYKNEEDHYKPQYHHGNVDKVTEEYIKPTVLYWFL